MLDGQNSLSSRKDLSPLSLKDICTLDILPQILEAGVTSLKIEGRMKKKEYTQGVVSIYRKYLDRYLEDPSGYQVDPEDKKALLGIFNRGGSCEGYYRSRGGKHMMAFSNEKKIQDTQIGIRKKKEKVKGNLILFPGEPAILELEYGACRVQVRHGCVQKAKNQPMDRERILAQIKKSGGTPYELDPVSLSMGEDIFLPVKELNELRRRGLQELEERAADAYRRERPPKPEFAEKEDFCEKPRQERRSGEPWAFYASCETGEQFAVCEEERGIKGIYANYREIRDCLKRGNPKGKELYWMFPHVERMADQEFYSKERCQALLDQGLSGFLVRSLESYCRLETDGVRLALCSGQFPLHVESSRPGFLEERGVLRDTVPLELNGRELSHRRNEKSELLIYGYLPLMISAQCVRKNLDRCRNDGGRVFLKDRYGKIFPVQCFCGSCYNVIYNSLPYGLPDEAEQIRALGPAALRLSFTLEDAAEVRRILRDFRGSCQTGRIMPKRELTKGHFKRGVE